MYFVAPARNYLGLIIVAVLTPAILSGCATTDTNTVNTRKSGFSLTNIKTTFGGMDPKYSELAKGPLAGEISSNLPKAALKKAIEAEYQALEHNKPGEIASWEHSDDQKGRITPFPPYRVGSSDCRRYIHRVSIDGKTSQATGTACRDKEGVWSPLT